MRKRLAFIVLFWPLALSNYAQINLNKQSGYTKVGISEQFTTPLQNNMGVFVTFTYIVCGLLGLIGGLRIYSRWQMGHDQITIDIARWAMAIIVFLLLMSGLQLYLETMPINGKTINQQQFGINP